MDQDAWRGWQRNVIATVRYEYHDLFPYLQQDDIDWDAWRPLFEQGYGPRAAVAQALSGNLAENEQQSSIDCLLRST